MYHAALSQILNTGSVFATISLLSSRSLEFLSFWKNALFFFSIFSGVIFDFTLVYDKPVIYTDPDIDLAPYDAWWLKGRTLWTATALPRLGLALTEENMEDLKALIDRCLEDPRFAAGRREVLAETWKMAGEGAVRTADYLCESCERLTRKEEAQRA